jgi:hypothetical protein
MQINRLAAALCLLFVLAAPALAQFSKSTMNGQVSSQFPDNTTGAITPATTRTFLNNIISSYQQAPQVNAQVGATYTIAASDYGQLVTFNNAASIAVTLAQATGSFATFNVNVVNLGAGVVTVTPTTSTINGASSITVSQNQSLWIFSDGTNWQVAKGYGSGTVSSVALTMPAIFSVSGSPITGSGTLAVTAANENANLVWSGPSSGGAATPTFRALVTADMPTPFANLASGTSGGVPYFSSTTALSSSALLTANGVLLGGGAGSAPTSTAAGTNGQLLVGQTSAGPTWNTAGGDISAISAGGSFTIANNVISNAKFRQSAALSVVGNGTNATANTADIAGTANQTLVVNSGGTALAFGQLNLASSAAVTGALPLANGGTSQTTAATARASSGLNIDQITGHGDSIYTILATDRVVGTNASFTASRTWTLPAANAVNAGQMTLVADFQGTVTASNTLVISRAGADTINGGTTVTISAANGAYLLWSDGTSKWTAQSIGPASAGGVTSITCNGGLTGGVITTSGTCAVDIATNSNIWSATANKPVDAAGLNNAQNPVALTDAATITTDMSTFINGTVTLAGNRTLGNPSNTQAGRCGFIVFTQDATGTRTLAYASNWKFVNAVAPVLSTAANAVDTLNYCVVDSTHIHAALMNNVK